MTPPTTAPTASGTIEVHMSEPAGYDEADGKPTLPHHVEEEPGDSGRAARRGYSGLARSEFQGQRNASPL
jgi:hypothetical protein